MRRGYLMISVAIAGIYAAEASSAAVLAWITVRVRIYDTAGLLPPVRQSALRFAAASLTSASVEAIWLECYRDPAANPSACATPLRGGELSVRLVRSTPPGAYRGGLALGYALVDASSGNGVLATVYYERVEWLARAARKDVSELLGRAIAHEIGHLMLRSSAHSSSGLMRAVWARDQLQRGTAEDWLFTRADAEAIRAEWE